MILYLIVIYLVGIGWFLPLLKIMDSPKEYISIIFVFLFSPILIPIYIGMWFRDHL